MIQLKQMKNKFDNILLTILWLLAMCLGTDFWLNTKFNFNIFSGEHWKYLSYIQASNQHINLLFYVSLAVAIAITIIGMYILIHPNIVKIVKRRKNISNTRQPAPITPSITPKTETPTQSTPIMPVRPPRPTMVNTIKTTPSPTVKQTNTPQTSNLHISEIEQIFTDANYVTKKAPKINGIQISLFAVGTNETVFIGAENVSIDDMQAIIDKLNGIFTETLEDIEITIVPFIITTQQIQSDNILIFQDLSELSSYMNEHQNPPLSDDDDGNFEAFSSYITTVGEYIGNI